MLRIKEIAKEKGLTIADVAKRMGILPPALSRIINGSNTTIETLQRIADVLEVDISELFVNESVIGAIRAKGQTYEINSLDDIVRVLEDIKGK